MKGKFIFIGIGAVVIILFMIGLAISQTQYVKEHPTILEGK